MRQKVLAALVAYQTLTSITFGVALSQNLSPFNMAIGGAAAMLAQPIAYWLLVTIHREKKKKGAV